MNTSQPVLPAPAGSMSSNDIFYIIFRHKWKIVISTLAGFGAAAAFYFLLPPPYESDAMLFIRYVTENSTPGLPGSGEAKAVSLADLDRGSSILNTEVDILGSLDIANQVADAVGPDKILSQVKNPKDRDHGSAAASVLTNLDIEPLPKSSVIHVIYKNPDPAVVQQVLTAVVDAYYKKHVEVHRQAGAIGDFLSQETDQLRARLQQTEDELRKEKDKAGIISLDDSKKDFNDQESRLEEEIFGADAELAERSARYDELVKLVPSAPKTVATKGGPATPPVPAAQIDNYRNILAQLDYLQKIQQQLLSQFTEQNQQVKDVRARIADAEKQRQAIEDQYPRLAQFGLPSQLTSNSSGGAAQGPAGTADLQTEAAYLAGLQSKIKVLTSQLGQVKATAATVDGLEGNISELQRQKDLEEANYKYYSEHLEASRIDEALGAGRALNIAEIQSPTPPHQNFKKFYQITGGIAASGLVFGLAWAFLIEFYLDRSIRRPQDVEKGLRVPLFLSIPHFGKNGHHKDVFHETLRDRLIAYFESKGLTHKPKLVAVTGICRNAGVTTTAAGLARSLSETGEGNVLLVDMTQTQGSAQQFNKGNAVCGLDQMLDTRDNAQVQENLYVVGAEPNSSDKLSKALPSRFNSLVPKLKASDFDYIIFDMPAVNQISITPRLAQFMDMVLLVVESEHTDRDLAKQAVNLLAESRCHVGAILNKSRNYIPSRAHHEFLGSA